MTAPAFDWAKYEKQAAPQTSEEPAAFDWTKYEKNIQNPVTLKGTAGAYASGVGGGVGGGSS